MNILLPIFAMVLLTIVCTLRLAFLRFSAIRRGEIDPRYFRLYKGFEEPDKLRVHSRHLINLFEAPILFYVVVIVAFITRQSGILPVVLAWVYVALRYTHSWVHLTSNNVLLRFRVFALSMVILVTFSLVIFAGIVFR